MELIAVKSGFGGFRVGGMELGLPMQVLREVLPCGVLAKLPCAAPCVIGGIDLRGVMVPVVDLRIILGIPAPEIPFRNVMIMAHENRLLGLLTEAVTGVFTGDSREINQVRFAVADQSVFHGSIRRSDNGTLVNLLSPSALATLRDVPLADHQEIENTAAGIVVGSQTDTVSRQDKTIPVLLLRCNQIAFAIDAIAVHTTLSDPEIKHSPLAMGSCRGVIGYAGNNIPILDLLEICGLGKIEPDTPRQAFLIQFPKGGMVAFLVNKVIDVIRIGSSEIIDVPAYALPRSSLFCGAIPKSSFPASVSQQKSILASQFLMLNSAGLKSDHEIAVLADVNSPEQAIVHQYRSQITSTTSENVNRKRSMVTYLLRTETATPFEQIREILTFSRSILIFEQTGPLLGMLVVRGRSIPVVCLYQLVTGQSTSTAPPAYILVVDIDNEAMGFAIPALKSIEVVEWEPELPRLGKSENDDLKRAIYSNKLAQIGNGDSIRMLPVLDLKKIGHAFRAQQLTAA